MIKFGKYVLIVLFALTLAACAAKKPAEDGPSTDTTPGDQPSSQQPSGGPSTSGAGAGAGVQVDPLDDPNSMLADRVILFDFDRSEIKDEYRDMLRAHAQFLSRNPGQQVTLEGHADERGSREYNIGLGERRAESVKRFLLFNGASESQLSTVSYGEERPVALSHDESAWAQNRRVELVYQR